MNEVMNNAAARHCPKNKMFSGSQSLLYQVALVVGQQTQGADKYMSDVYEMLGMTMSTQQQTFWSQRQKDEQTMLNTRKNPQGNVNEAMQSIVHDLKQLNKKRLTSNEEELTNQV